MRASAVIAVLSIPTSHFQHSIASKRRYPIDHLFAIPEIHPFRNKNYKGTEGELPGSDRKVTGPVDIESYKGRGGIFGDFVYSVLHRERAFRDIEIAHRATTICHLGNIAYWLKRPLKWDPDKEEIIGDPEAARWLDRPMRAPWTLEA